MNNRKNKGKDYYSRRGEDRPRKKRKRQFNKVGIEIMSDRPSRESVRWERE